jgi:hypothetical protein
MSNVVFLAISTVIDSTENGLLLVEVVRALVFVGQMTGSSAVLVGRMIAHHRFRHVVPFTEVFLTICVGVIVYRCSYRQDW